MNFFLHEYNIIAKEQRFFWSHRYFRISTLLGVLFLASSLLIHFFVSRYASHHFANYLTKQSLFLRLSSFSLQVAVVDALFVFAILLAALVIYKPQVLPFLLKILSLFILVQATFILLTHLEPLPNAAHNGLSLSLLTSLPLLLTFACWKDRFLRYLLLAITGIGAAALIITSLAYSIDIFAAFFITYTIFHMSTLLFLRDYHIFSLVRKLQSAGYGIQQTHS